MRSPSPIGCVYITAAIFQVEPSATAMPLMRIVVVDEPAVGGPHGFAPPSLLNTASNGPWNHATLCASSTWTTSLPSLCFALPWAYSPYSALNASDGQSLQPETVN